MTKSGRLVREVNAALISTIAGALDSSGFSGDGRTASKALLAGPEALAFDSTGNLYIADNANNRVHKVDTSGMITPLQATAPRSTSCRWRSKEAGADHVPVLFGTRSAPLF